MKTVAVPLELCSYGKLPLAKEYLKIKCFSGAAGAFRQWIAQGCDHVLHAGQGNCDIDVNVPWRVLFFPEGLKDGIVAVIHQSTDEGGARVFPHSVFCTISRKHLGNRAGRIVEQVRNTWDELDRYAVQLGRLGSLADYEKTVLSAELAPFIAGGNGAGIGDGVSLDRFAQGLFDDADPPAQVAAMLWDIRIAYRAIAGGRIPGHRLPGLRLPLAGGIDTLPQAIAWIGCLEASGFLVERAKTPVSVFLPGIAGRGASLWVLRRPPVPRDFMMLAATHEGYLHPKPEELPLDVMGRSRFIKAAVKLVADARNTLHVLGESSLEDLGQDGATA